ncbi:MAG: fumarylacetoacetate hydrolase family protein [Nitrososphaerota archaeon]|nr:fumarylacetoacetate hydrolase family protein [Nitrososphaerota archaeon]
MRIIGYSLDGERDYGFMVSDEEFVPRPFIESAIGLSIPPDVKELLPDRELLQIIESALEGIRIEKVPIDGVHIDPPIPNPGKIICLGLNYADHAGESGLEPPEGMPIFFKPATALNGPYDPIVKPRIVRQLDYEIELAVIIADRCRNVRASEAIHHVFGYSVFNDVSARDIQFLDGQWTRGKSFDTFAPIGPWIVSADELGDPHNLRMMTRVNGEIRQNSSTSKMLLKIPEIISLLSQVMTLEPGDIIATGTPAGVGMFWKPEPKLLEPGDTVEMWIEKIGLIRNDVIAEE